MVILGIDPGYAIVGYGVIRAQNGRFVPLEHGAIVTKAGENFNRRLEIIYDAMTEVLQKWKPDAVSIEKLYFKNNGDRRGRGARRDFAGDPKGRRAGL